MSRTLLRVATDWPGHHPDVAATIALLIDHGADVGRPLRRVRRASPGGRGGTELVPPWSPLTPLDAAEEDGATDLVAWLRGRGARSAADPDR